MRTIGKCGFVSHLWILVAFLVVWRLRGQALKWRGMPVPGPSVVSLAVGPASEPGIWLVCTH